MEETKEIKLKRLKTTNKILNIIQLLIIFFIIIFAVNHYITNNNCNEDDPEVIIKPIITKETFNNKFTAYIGEEKSPSYIKALINMVLANNATNEERQVKINNITISKDSADIILKQLSAFADDVYSVSIESNNEGYIANIEIKNSEGKQILVEE